MKRGATELDNDLDARKDIRMRVKEHDKKMRGKKSSVIRLAAAFELMKMP